VAGEGRKEESGSQKSKDDEGGSVRLAKNPYIIVRGYWMPTQPDGCKKGPLSGRLFPRNLSDVFCEMTPCVVALQSTRSFEDAVFYDPKGGIFRGRDEIDRIASLIKATHPDFEYQPLFPPEELGDAGRVRWVSGAPGKPPAYAGTDFIVARNGRIASLYLFFDNLP
jgi:hypothetical protein